MGDILGYARVSTGDQDVSGQTMRLEKAGAIKVFTDVMSGKSMERPGLAELIAYAREKLSGVKIPRRIDFMEALPRHDTGKLYKRLLRDQYWEKAKAGE